MYCFDEVNFFSGNTVLYSVDDGILNDSKVYIENVTGVTSSSKTVIPIPLSINDTFNTVVENPQADSSSISEDGTNITQSFVITNTEVNIGGTTYLDYPIPKPTSDPRLTLQENGYKIDCSVGLYIPTSTPGFSGSCVVQFYRKAGTDISVVDSQILYIPTGLNDVSDLNSFSAWEFSGSTTPSFDFTTKKCLRLNFSTIIQDNLTIFSSDYNNLYNNLGIRIKPTNGSSGYIGTCVAIASFKP